MDALDDRKREAAEAAVAAHVGDGMVLGLGSGSTASHVVRTIGRLLAEGRLRDVRGVPTSERTADLARTVGVPLLTLEEAPRLALDIDGADEIAPDLGLVKGLGGALLREKVVVAAAERFVVVADATKLVPRLGRRAPLPVEVVPFALPVCRARLGALDGLGEPVLRREPDGRPFVTDEGNHILDCPLQADDPERLAALLGALPGVVEHGLFLGMAAEAFVAGPDGTERLRAGATTTAG